MFKLYMVLGRYQEAADAGVQLARAGTSIAPHSSCHSSLAAETTRLCFLRGATVVVR